MVSLFAHAVVPLRDRGLSQGLLIGALLVVLCLLSRAVHAAQDNFEIHVFPSETLEAGHVAVSLHSNMAVSGTTQEKCGVLPDQHALNESVELEYGFTPWFETHFYTAASLLPGMDAQYVGNRVFPHIRVPESWGLPVGLGFGTAIAYQRRDFSTDTWTLEIIPIIDKRWGPWYLAANPEFIRSLKGQHAGRGFDFSPSCKVSYDLTRTVAAGFEYYATYGPLTGFEPVRKQQQQLFSVIDLNPGPDWEVNFGVGVGLTQASDSLVVKMILGRRF